MSGLFRLSTYQPIHDAGEIRLRAVCFRKARYSPSKGTLVEGIWYKTFFTDRGLLVSSMWKNWTGAPTQWLIPWEVLQRERQPIQLEDVYMALQRLTEQRKKAALGPAAEDSEMKEKFPVLYEHLTSRSFGKGEPRKTSTLNVFADQGAWKAFLNERNDGLCLCVTAETLVGLFDVLEASLGHPDADWRPSKFNGGGGDKKK